MIDAASAAQIRAASPGTSTWLSANAGSGKTRVLTNRVALLLLEGTPPERILCLTYTKAAAGEMQNRLFAQLGQWAMAGDDTLRAELAKMGAAAPDAARLSHARTLFARAIETPGGLKIQTIHAFCAGLLRRFPLEAGVSPQFSEMDDRQKKLLAADTLEAFVSDTQGQALFDAVAAELTDQDASQLTKDLITQRRAFAHPLTRTEVFDMLDADEAFDVDALIADVIPASRDLFHALLPMLTDKQGALIKRIETLNWDAPTLDDLRMLELMLLMGPTAKKAPLSAKAPVKKDIFDQLGEGADALLEIAERLEIGSHARRAYIAAHRTHALHAFAHPYLQQIEAAKAARGWLDFDDLIDKANVLLSRSDVAQWVLFKLDGGIDHILVDEAQDTSPMQWQVVRALSQEFASGEGARPDDLRTIFVVGDKKQSIYSFQGADPRQFDAMRQAFGTDFNAVDAPFQSEELVFSFRTSPLLLELVDEVCGGGKAPGAGDDVAHAAFFIDKPGRIEILPHIEEVKPAQQDTAWFEPLDQPARNHHHVEMARQVADKIQTILADKTPIEVKGKRRPVEPGDITILVRRRKDLSDAIIAECKRRDLPFAGADVMNVAQELAVRDLTALLQFLATPEDDLSLACVLRSPLFGLSEDDLFRLAHNRDKRFLWSALRDAEATHPRTVAILTDLRDGADYRRPFEVLDRMLTRHGGRKRLLARLGQECEEGLDALLHLALSFETTAVPSLVSFLSWLEADDVKIKRQHASGGNLIRVMTVHGAKGLESPVVILPETEMRRRTAGAPLVTNDEDLLCWKPPNDDSPLSLINAVAARNADQDAEVDRLLYVALTRAESWLIVGAAGSLGDKKKDNSCWYKMIRAGAEAIGGTPTPEGGVILQSGDWTTPGDPVPPVTSAKVTLPPWSHTSAPAPVVPPAPQSPSSLGGAKALPGEGDGLSEDLAKARGTAIHTLLEHLPRDPTAADRLLRGLHPALDGETIKAEARAVLDTPALAPLFAEGTLAEVPFTAAPLPGSDAPLEGIIDRLLIDDTRVLAVDFKSNAVVPQTPQSVPLGLLRQMGAYAYALAQIYPDHDIQTALLWTRTTELMELPHDLVTGALQQTTDG